MRIKDCSLLFAYAVAACALVVIIMCMAALAKHEPAPEPVWTLKSGETVCASYGGFKHMLADEFGVPSYIVCVNGQSEYAWDVR